MNAFSEILRDVDNLPTEVGGYVDVDPVHHRKAFEAWRDWDSPGLAGVHSALANVTPQF